MRKLRISLLLGDLLLFPAITHIPFKKPLSLEEKKLQIMNIFILNDL